MLLLTDDGLFWCETGVFDWDGRRCALLLSLPGHKSSGAELHRAQRWSGTRGMDCRRFAGCHGGLAFHVLW